MTRSASRRRVVFLTIALGAVVTVGVAVANYRTLVSQVVLTMAFREAETMAEELRSSTTFSEWNTRGEACTDILIEKYGSYFEREYFNPSEFLSRFPESGLQPESTAALLVGAAYFRVFEERLQDEGLGPRMEEEAVFKETQKWLDAVLLQSRCKELLVNLLIRDYTVCDLEPGAAKEFGEELGEGFPKMMLATFLFHPWLDGLPRGGFSPGGEGPKFVTLHSRNVSTLKSRHWTATLRDCDHPREKVRAGSLLLLNHHPSEAISLPKLRDALGDPSPLVRLAAAGLLALRREDRGEAVLLENIAHERWEIRWWCALGLAVLGKEAYIETLERRVEAEPDPWVKTQVGGFRGHISSKTAGAR